MMPMSVIIPTHNRADQLRNCLDALAEQTETFDNYEVIVVLDGCTDHTEAMLAAAAVPYPLRVLQQERQGQAAARNRGGDAASGRVLLFLDDDVVPTQGLVEHHLRLHRTRGRAVGLGALPLLVRQRAHWYVRWFEERWNTHFLHLGMPERRPSWQDCYGGNLSVPRAAFVEIGGFATDVPHSHDAELGYRLEESGMSFVYLADAAGRHDDTKGLRELTSAIQRHGAAAVELSRRHPGARALLLEQSWHAGPRTRILRRFLLLLDLPPDRLARAGSLLPSSGARAKWASVVHSYGYWRGVASALGRGRRWRKLPPAEAPASERNSRGNRDGAVP